MRIKPNGNNRHSWKIGAMATAGTMALAVPVGFVLAEEPTGESTGPRAGCTVDTLPLPDGATAAEAHSVSPSGEYIAGVAEGTPAMWHDGEVTAIADATGYDGTRSSAVSDTGIVVGTSALDDYELTEGWVYRDGAVSTLTAPIGDEYSVHPADVNDAGVIVGSSHQLDAGPVHALIWEENSTEATVLEVPDGATAQASEFLADGSVFGSVTTADGTRQSWIWDTDGSGDAMVLPELPDVRATEVAGDWVLIDSGDPESDEVVEYRWNRSDDAEPEELDQLDGAAHIDTNGRVYGTTDGQQPAMLGIDGVVTEMPKLDSSPDDWLDNYLLDTDDAGSTVVGMTLTGEGTIPAVWSCE